MSKKLEAHKQAEINVRGNTVMEAESRKPFGFPAVYWVKWAAIIDSFERLGVKPGSKILDLGCGAGWTSIFLAESGFKVVGVDIVPSNVDVAKARAKKLRLPCTFQVGDMDNFALKEKFDAVLVFDALHHTIRQPKVIRNIAKHLNPGGWVLCGEPSILHTISPEARRTTREEGVIERGITVRSIKRDCRKAGLGNYRRFFESTRPYESRIKGFSWQLIRLVSANFFFAPQASLWFAAQKPAKKK